MGVRTGFVRRLVGVMTLVLLVAVGCSDDGTDEEAAEQAEEAQPDVDATEGDASSEGISQESVDESFGVLDGIVADVMDATGVPGVAVAVVYGDEAVYEQGYGVRMAGGDDPVDPATVFQIASLSKPVSSTIMAGLAGQGVIGWDDPIYDYTVEFELSDEWVTEHVTFADLFSHRSGLPGGTAGNDLEAIGYDRDEILPRLRLVPLDGFRDVYSYSNWGMTLGGEVAAIAAGSDWETVSEEVLFNPAGMEDTSMRYEDLVATENRAALHVPLGEGEWAADFERDPEPQAPAGGVSSNVKDLAQWMRLQLADGELDGEPIIDPETLAQTHVPHITSRPPNPPNGGQPGLYGLGWNIGTEFGGYVTWGHAGAFSNGASTYAKLIPAESFGVVVLTNGAPVGAPEAITDAYVDYLITGEDNTEEWLATWTQRMAGVYGEPLDLGEPPAEPTAAAAAGAYEGSYSNEYVGEVEISAGDDAGTLEMTVGPVGISYTLEHWDADTFVYVHDPELPEFLETATFEMVDGEAVSLTLSAMDGAGLGTLERT